MRCQKLAADNRNPDRATPAVRFRGDGRRMVVSGEHRLNASVIEGCDLAELVLSEDGQSLVLRVNEVKNATIEPYDLYAIGEGFRR
jgi:hypothetical protein